MTPGQAAHASPHGFPAQRAARGAIRAVSGQQARPGRLPVASTRPGSGPERMMQALSGFQEAAQAAVTHWGGDLTIRQGLNVTWMLGNIIRDLRIAAGLLSNFTVTGPAGARPGAPGSKASEPARLVSTSPRGQAGLPAPDREISEAAQCLGTAAGRALALPGAPVRSASPEGATVPGGDPRRDGPAAAAARDMRNALGVAAGTWMNPSGSDEDRDKIVTEMLFAVDRLEVATLVLAQGGPPNVQEALRQVARDLDSSCIHLRESVACSLTRGHQPGTGNLARQLRQAFPVLSEARPVASPGPNGTGRQAPSLAATAFPHPAGDVTPASSRSPRQGAAGDPSQPKRPGSARRRP